MAAAAATASGSKKEGLFDDAAVKREQTGSPAAGAGSAHAQSEHRSEKKKKKKEKKEKKEKRDKVRN